MEEAKLLSYSEFREKICVDGKKYFQNPRLKKQNFEVRIREERDVYDTPEDMAYLFDQGKPELSPPSYSVLISYETYCRSKDADKVIRTLSGLMEKQYPEEPAVPERKEQTCTSVVTALEGNQEQEVSAIYVITDAEGRNGNDNLLHDEDTLSSLAEKEQANLQMIPLASDVLLAVPVHTAEEYEENLAMLAELRKMEQKLEQEKESQVYDRSRNLLLKDPEEIKELLLEGKVRKRGIFSR